MSGRFSPTTIASAHAHKEAKIPMKTSGRLRKQLSKLLASAERFEALKKAGQLRYEADKKRKRER